MNRFRIGLSAFAALAGAAFAAFPARGYEVSADTMVVNPGQHVAVPVRFDTVKGASHVSVRIAYDPHVLVLLKVAEGPLTRTLSDDFVTVADEKSGEVTVSAFGIGNVIENVGGVLATLQFAVRENTQSLYSDIAIANVKIGEASGVKDVTVANPIRSVNGMVRVVASSDAVTRLDQPQTIGADAVLGALSLKAGDALQASDSQSAIRVAGAVTKEDAVIAVKAPVNGWASGDYALISTSSDGLGLALADLPAETSVTYYSKTEGAVVTYFANVIIAGELPVVADGGESLTAGTMNLIRNNARLSFEGKSDELSLHRKDLFKQAKRIRISGPKGMVPVISDMGISPAFPASVDETGTLHLSYAMPQLEVTSFDSDTGAIRFKVTPGAGNQIVSEIAKGYLHVYGTDRLGETMRCISSVGFDLTPYLKPETKGEGVLTVTMGSYTFFRVKVE